MKLIRLLAIFTFIFIAVACFAEPAIVIRNNHELDYSGPVTFKTTLQPLDGFYEGDAGYAIVYGGLGKAVVKVAGQSEARLAKTAAHSIEGPFNLMPGLGGVTLRWDGHTVGYVDFGLAVIPDREGDYEQAVSQFKPLLIRFDQKFDGSLVGKCHYREYEISITLTPYPGGWMDADTTITRILDGPQDEYLALVRRITMPMDDIRMRWNGREFDGLDLKGDADRIFTLSHGVEWCSWTTGDRAYSAINKSSPGYTYESQPGRWSPANHFYTWEKAVQQDGNLYLISEVAGPNPGQETSGSMRVRAYTPPLKNEPVRLGWRLATAKSRKPGWETSQLYTYAGLIQTAQAVDTATVDIGAPYVEFGTSYFPYSTMCENFDFYRTADLDREGWWPFSPEMWEDWRKFQPQMDTDLRIIKAMGFDWVRLHHMELLGQMNRENALAFLDYYMGTAKMLGMRALVDSAGSPEWLTLIAARYKDVVKRIELENEILIGGIKPGDAERWTAQYSAIKQAVPDTQVFLTGACNQGMFERLNYLKVPFDRIGYHNYKHGPGWKEASSSVVLAVASHATSLRKPITLGEFNWKFLTEYSPEARAQEFAEIYGNMLAPRAVPEFFQFHWQETLSVNPRLTRQGIRHYETIHLDRRPKPEAIEFMKLIRRYANPESPYRELPIQIEEHASEGGVVSAKFTISNETRRPIEAALSFECYDGLQCQTITPNKLTLKPGESRSGKIELALHPQAAVGVYHYFVRADYGGKSAYGWGMLSKPGSPTFSPTSLGDLVEYPRGPDVVTKLDYSQPICVAFGDKNPIIEMEMAYMIRNTLQVVIGQPVHLCRVADIPKSFQDKGNLILVGTPESNKLIGMTNPELTDKGAIILQDVGSGCQWLYLTGKTSDAVQAAATEYVLRYWQTSREAVRYVFQLEKGAALGKKAAPGDVNLP